MKLTKQIHVYKGELYMISVEAIVSNKTGLHARPANLFVKEANKHKSSIKIIKDGNEYNAKSIFSVLAMAAGMGTKLEIVADGEDEEIAIKSLKDLIDSKFGE